MPGNTCTCTCKCNAGVVDLTGGSDDERIKSSRNNSGGLRRPNKQSRQAGKFNDIEITKATIQTSCTVCLKKFETIKSEGGRLMATVPCGHIFCRSCLLMTLKTRTKYLQDGTKYMNCPTCSTRFLENILSFVQIHL